MKAQPAPSTTVRNIGHDVWVATDGHGVFVFSDAKKVQRLTFDGTGGGLRSDHVYTIFQDREGVIWFGTDRGVCRYEPNSARVESVGDSPESNFVRTFYELQTGHLLAGTNRGLFVYSASSSGWKPVAGLGGNIIYALGEDNSGRLLVASAGFLCRANTGARNQA